MTNRLKTVMLFCLVLVSAMPGFAQGTGATLSGTVLDPSGARIIGAQVTAENVKTGVVLTNKSNDAGVYLFVGVPPGIYRMTVEAPGFRKYILSDVLVEVAGHPSINFSLVVGTVTASMEVTASPNSLFTDSASVGGVISGQRLQELPLPARDALGLVLTQPGLVGDNFAGARISAVNVTRDGVSVTDQLVNSGVFSVIFSSTDVVAEVRVITSPVDAELGRGSGQVNLITRSGTNAFHGTLFETHANTALNANDWFSNLRGESRNSLIVNSFGATFAGPIRHDKTFFFAAYEGDRGRYRDAVTSLAYTSTARQGIFRFYPGVQNAGTDAAVPTVDLAGNPVQPASATGPLQSVPLFNRDLIRPGFDRTGTVEKLLAVMPLPNNFRFGDGLNTSGYTWKMRSTNDGNQYSGRIDHHINNKHDVSFTISKVDLNGQNAFMPQPFPTSPGGSIKQYGAFYSLGFDSILSSSKINEFRGGAQRTRARYYAPWELPGGRELLPSVQGYDYLPVFNLASDPITTENDPQGRISPLYSYRDTFHWTTGRHALKFGGEMRFSSSNSFNSFDVMPRVFFGLGFFSQTSVNSAAIAGLGVNEGLAQGLLTDLTGTVGAVGQSFNASPGTKPVFVAGENRQRTWRQREFNLFVQDDFRLKPGLTVYAGLRYEFYGVPWDALGRTTAPVGGSNGLFGISGKSWEDVYNPHAANGDMTRVQLIGKKSPNPNVNLYANDLNNFAPAIGFAWSIPYFGKDKTVLRVGYSVSYDRNALRLVDIVSGDEPGLTTQGRFLAETAQVDLTNLVLPLEPLTKPLEIVPFTDRNQVVRAFDNNLRTPYIQNWNLSIQRNLPAGFTLDVRYVGSKGTKLIRSVNINEVNIFENGILDAFKITQAGGNAQLFDQLFLGFNLGLGTINGSSVRGSPSLRTLAVTRQMLANNEVGEFADFINRVSISDPGDLLRFPGLPENWIVANPQFAGANFVGNFSNSTYHSLQIEGNRRLSKGWTLESNYTWSRTLGDEEGSSQEILNSFRNGRNRHLDKRLLAFHRTHVFRNSTLYELPFGPDRLFLSGARGVLAQIVRGWQFGGILNVFSGNPIGLGSAISSFNQHLDNTPTLVGSLPKSAGEATRTANGVVYFNGYTQVADPGIAALTPSQLLDTRSTLKAIADPSGNVVAVNPTAGTLGSMSQTYLQGPGAFRFDLNLIKKFRFGEGKEIHVRADAINVLNKPVWGNPITEINSTNFGRIESAGGNRNVTLNMRVVF